jgi:hypothetical protein
MVEVVFSPVWFYGKDIVIDIVSIVVLFLIAFFSFRYYRLDTKKKNYIYLALSFLMIGISFIFKILTNFTIYYKVLETRHFGLFTFTYETLKQSDTLFFIGFLLYRLLMLFGLYVLYTIYYKQSKSNMLLVFYLIIISTYFSQSAYYIFHITSFIFLVLLSLHLLTDFKKKPATAKLLASSFIIITISNLFFVFVNLNLLFYVISEIIQLIGYILLLITFIMVLTHGKKKK